MLSVAALVGLGCFGLMLFLVAGLLRQLGAGEAAKGLIILTGLLFAAVIAVTYVPAIISGF